MIKFLLQIIFILVATTASVYATDLLTVYQQALQTDPTILQAKALAAASGEILPQSRAILLPNLSASAKTFSVHNGGAPNYIDAGNGYSSQNSINQHDYALTLTQPLFNIAAITGLTVAHAKVRQAKATYRAALQSAIISTATAYFNVLQAKDMLQYTQAQQKATAKQLMQIKAKYQVGVATMTDVYQAQAAYDELNAKVISAKNTVNNNLQALQQITGMIYRHIAPLKKDLSLLTPIPNDVTAWIIAAEKYNSQLLAARYAAAADKATIHQNFANHLPTVNAVGGYQRGNDLNSFQSSQWQSQVGVQVNLPLFAGGIVNSQTRQAQDQYVASSSQVEIIHRQAISDVKQYFNNVTAGISEIQADHVAVMSGQNALVSTQAGYNVGTKTVLDVLTAEENLYQAKSTLASDQYSYLLNTLQLKEAAGTLRSADVVAINRWLQ